MSITTPLNARFQESYTSYKARIEKVTDVAQRNSLLEMLTSIANGMMQIEKAHENALFGNRQPLVDIRDNRSTITNLRKQLEQRLAALKV